MSNKVKVVICGKDFTLQTAESSNYVFGLARTLESRITEITDANSSASPFTAPSVAFIAFTVSLTKTLSVGQLPLGVYSVIFINSLLVKVLNPILEKALFLL